MPQTCDPALTASTPLSARFTTPDAEQSWTAGPVLTSMRCAVGQRWDGAGCTGNRLASSSPGAFDRHALVSEQGGGSGACGVTE
ncbi:MAG: hypothetical protein IPK65_14530 [Gammaproteobacteria bacterium]|nr:hypothetical protein [Gammaproteobacteria bacterium]